MSLQKSCKVYPTMANTCRYLSGRCTLSIIWSVKTNICGVGGGADGCCRINTRSPTTCLLVLTLPFWFTHSGCVSSSAGSLAVYGNISGPECICRFPGTGIEVLDPELPRLQCFLSLCRPRIPLPLPLVFQVTVRAPKKTLCGNFSYSILQLTNSSLPLFLQTAPGIQSHILYIFYMLHWPIPPKFVAFLRSIWRGGPMSIPPS